MSEPGRDALIRSVAGRVDSAGDDGAAAARNPAATREAEELLMRHLATPDGTDPEVQYTVGVLYLLRAVTPRADETAPANDSGEPAVALTLLAPFYQHPPEAYPTSCRRGSAPCSTASPASARRPRIPPSAHTRTRRPRTTWACS